MRIYICKKFENYPGIYTNDLDLINFLKKNSSCESWFVILDNKNKIVGEAFLYSTPMKLSLFKKLLSVWKQQLRQKLKK